MQPLFLHLDGSLDAQSTLLAQGRFRRLLAHDLGPALRLWSRPPALAALAERLGRLISTETPDLVFAGSGDFHHVTPMLIERAIGSRACGPVTVIHFDNHPDWVRFANGLHCGSWVGRAARLPEVARLITVGVCSDDLDRPRAKGADLDLIGEGRVEIYPYRTPRGAAVLDIQDRAFPAIETLGEAAFVELLVSRIETEDVYVTIDKDVLRSQDALTNWDQGRISLSYLETLIHAVCDGRRLIGADVVGDWSRPVYGPEAWSGLLKRGEALLDQPRRRPPFDLIRLINETTNLRLLKLFAEIAP
jgi:hypothetical protein